MNKDTYVLYGIIDTNLDKIIFIDEWIICWDEPETYENIDWIECALIAMRDTNNNLKEYFKQGNNRNNYRGFEIKRYDDYEEAEIDRKILCNMLMPIFNKYKIYYNDRGNIDIDWDAYNFTDIYYKDK